MHIDYYKHLVLLVTSLEFFFNKTIAKNKLIKVQKNLELFVENSPKLYDDFILKSGFHELLHLSDQVKNFGPLNSGNFFQFEKINRKISRMIKRQNLIGEESIKLFNLVQKLSTLSINFDESNSIQNFILENSILGTSNRKKNQKECTLKLGSKP